MSRLNTGMCQEEIAATVTAHLPLTGQRPIYSVLSRLLDVVLVVIALAVAVPVVLTFAMLIRLETPGSPFYSQVRVGKNGKLFTLYKLRSMYSDAERDGAQWATKNDPRITRVGSFIRRSRIDELPQLLNILKGDMSIVGPRPERPEFTVEFQKTIPEFVLRLKVKPGLTGWAQVSGGYELTPQQKWEADMYYVTNKSLLLDLRIILMTVRVILTGEGAR